MSLLKKIHLDDKYTQQNGDVFLTGTQALVRLPLMQKQLDMAHGLNTAGFISGYRGSPLGGYDQALWKAQKFLKEAHVTFVPGINEDLGATAVWGSQQLHLSPGAQVQGVFGLWYGKGPGVDRTGDVFKHANAAGSSRYGGVLAIAGDDHACKSSTLPHQTEYAFMDAFIPVLHPTSIQEILTFGLYGWALSRFSGLWVCLKTISDTIDTAASVSIDFDPYQIIIPTEFTMPPGGLNLRWPDVPVEQERRLHDFKLKAVPVFARANRLDRALWKTKKTRIGLVATGKAYLDLQEALRAMGITEKVAESLGIAIYKVALTWPLEPEGIQDFCTGLTEVIVVEEKRPLIEDQLKVLLYGVSTRKRPAIVGKQTETGEPLFPAVYEMNVQMIGRILAKRWYHTPGFEALQPYFDTLLETAPKTADAAPLLRIPYYCSGCPHNTSTMTLPEGSRAMAGIGCHYMATWINPHTQTFTQMGGEGVPWIGMAPFTSESHLFANLGDGTYYHSGLLAIRAAVAARVNITYKILYNDAVAMTGGQPVDGPLSVADVTHQLRAEGIQKIAVVSDDIDKYARFQPFAKGTEVHHRSALAAVQQRFKETAGVTAIIYDQTCAAEKRRRRKRKLMEDPNRRVIINDVVCEGCGDCGKKSNCLSLMPLETEWGTKRAIDQSSCNKDFSCVNGFCPSFVSVVGGALRKPKGSSVPTHLLDKITAPTQPALDHPYSIFITGVGGTGVTTIGALLGMAAHLESKGCSVVDMAGLAQKGGAVVSHLKISRDKKDILAARVSTADLLLGFDVVVTSSPEALSKMAAGTTQVIVNTHQSVTGHFTQNPQYHFPADALAERIHAGAENTDSLDATAIATGLMGDAIYTNLFMVGYAFQKGLIPLSAEAILEAIRLNNVQIEANSTAFLWGRLMAVCPDDILTLALPPAPAPLTLEETINHRYRDLIEYQDEAYAQRYLDFMNKIKERDKAFNQSALTTCVAKTYHRLLAYKDEYEVARLYTNNTFMKKLEEQFEGNYKLIFHLAPPLLSRRDPHTKEPRKSIYGQWMMKAFALLARFKSIRGTALDIFGYTKERRMERQLITDYEHLVYKLLDHLTPETYLSIVEILELPQRIRGFGHVKEKNHQEIMALIHQKVHALTTKKLASTA